MIYTKFGYTKMHICGVIVMYISYLSAGNMWDTMFI